MYICKNCREVYRNDSNNPDEKGNCPECNGELIGLHISDIEWKQMSDTEKEQVKNKQFTHSPFKNVKETVLLNDGLSKIIDGGRCPKCGASMPASAKFCMECGYRVGENHENVNSKTDTKPRTIFFDNTSLLDNSESISMNAEISPNMQLCPECNAKVSRSAKSCPKCGYPFKRRFEFHFSKRVVMVSCIVIGTIVIIISSVLLINKLFGGSKIIKYYKANNIEAYNSLRSEISSDQYTTLRDTIKNDINTVNDKYVREEITYDEAVSEMERIKTFLDANLQTETDYAQVKRYLYDLKVSREAFAAAKEKEANGEYESAYENYEKVIKTDANYTIAQTKMAELIDTVVDEYLKDATNLAAKNQYSQAVSLLERAKIRTKNNSSIQAKIDEYKKEQKRIEKQNEEKEKQRLKLSVGGSITTDRVQATLKECSLTSEIYPDNRSGYYRYLSEDDPNEIWLDLLFSIKNTSSSRLNLFKLIEDISVEYDENYTYRTYGMYYVEGNKLETIYEYFDNAIDPLETMKVHVVIFNMPAEAKNSGKSVEVHIKLDGEQKIIKYR